jgi:hypothetical protein
MERTLVNKMKYAYVTFGNLKPEWFDKMDKLPAEMDRYKEHAEKHGFNMKYWGHPYGMSENIVAMFTSENDLGKWAKMNQGFTGPYTGARTVISARD